MVGVKIAMTPNSTKKFHPITPIKIYLIALESPAHSFINGIKTVKHPNVNIPVFIIGTMNTADKSISMIDVALRRRFSFIETPVDPSLIADSSLRTMLEKINSDLRKDFDDGTDLLIGHAYFINKSINDLPSIMNNSVIPLLYEYYFDKTSKVKSVISNALEGTNYEIDNAAHKCTGCNQPSVGLDINCISSQTSDKSCNIHDSCRDSGCKRASQSVMNNKARNIITVKRHKSGSCPQYKYHAPCNRLYRNQKMCVG